MTSYNLVFSFIILPVVMHAIEKTCIPWVLLEHGHIFRHFWVHPTLPLIQFDIKANILFTDEFNWFDSNQELWATFNMDGVVNDIVELSRWVDRNPIIKLLLSVLHPLYVDAWIHLHTLQDSYNQVPEMGSCLAFGCQWWRCTLWRLQFQV